MLKTVHNACDEEVDKPFSWNQGNYSCPFATIELEDLSRRIWFEELIVKFTSAVKSDQFDARHKDI